MHRILVVEDEAAIALGLGADLELEGYEVRLVDDGLEAARVLREDTFELVILDVMLPGKDGFEICRELRARGDRTPVLMLTAKTQEAEKVLGLELGADDYLTKPFSSLELRARIRALLRRASETAVARHRFGDFELDLRRFELRADGRPVALTPIETRILAALLERRGEAVSRDDILEAVWGPGTHVSARVIDNHVANLRKKIEPGAEPRWIVSVHGVGYRFE